MVLCTKPRWATVDVIGARVAATDRDPIVTAPDDRAAIMWPDHEQRDILSGTRHNGARRGVHQHDTARTAGSTGSNTSSGFATLDRLVNNRPGQTQTIYFSTDRADGYFHPACDLGSAQAFRVIFRQIINGLRAPCFPAYHRLQLSIDRQRFLTKLRMRVSPNTQVPHAIDGPC